MIYHDILISDRETLLENRIRGSQDGHSEQTEREGMGQRAAKGKSRVTEASPPVMLEAGHNSGQLKRRRH